MKKITFIFLTLIGLYFLSFVMANYISKDNFDLNDKIVVIPIEGIIAYSDTSQSLFSFNTKSLQDTIKQIKEVNQNNKIKGVILEINSPGGAVVASQDLSSAIKSVNKPKYAVIKEVGASGGYWAASSADKIYASELSITGSIGVVASYLQFEDLFEKYGVTYERLVTGKYKDLGSPWKDLTKEEKLVMDKKLQIIHNYFVDSVAKNRNMDISKIQELATGEFYLGIEAKDLGLIDSFGDTEKAIEDMKQQLNMTELSIEKIENKQSILNLITGNSAYYFGKGFGSAILELENKNKIKIEV